MNDHLVSSLGRRALRSLLLVLVGMASASCVDEKLPHGTPTPPADAGTDGDTDAGPDLDAPIDSL